MRGWKREGRLAAIWLLVSFGWMDFVHAQSLPAPWVARDIGSPLIAGSTSYSSPASFTVRGSGADIWGTSDQFQFAYVPVAGNVDVRARVDSVAATSSWAKVGVMIRGSLAANAAHAFTELSYARGMAFLRRSATGAITEHTAAASAGASRWVRLVRAGALVTSYSSVDGVAWTRIDSDTIALGTTAYVGIAATSRNILVLGTGRVSQVSFAAPSDPLPSQVSVDIGSPAQKGSASLADGVYTITAGGIDVWGYADQLHYVYQQVSGDLDVRVRIASISQANVWSKAGVMIRASLSPTAAQALALASAGRGYAFQRRPVEGGVIAGTAGPAGGPPGWLRLRRGGNLITAYQSADGVNWRVIGSDAIVAGDQVYVGIAVTSHSTWATTTVKADNFSVIQVPPNRAPTVSLATDGTSFLAPAAIPLIASASDPENQLARVEFFAGTTLLGTDTSWPYEFTWSNVRAGTYALTAVAYDAAGATGTSATVTVAVANPVRLSFTTTAADMELANDYELDVFPSTADPLTSAPIARWSLGKPVLDAADTATVDITAMYGALPAGAYVATVSAIWLGGASRSAKVAFTK